MQLRVFGSVTALLALPCVLCAQYGGGGGTSGGGAGNAVGSLNNNYHIGFERPEAWGLKYFDSNSLLSGLPAPPLPEGSHIGAVTISVETDWLPMLDAGQERIGFSGTSPEALNKAPVLIRPVIRVTLPKKFTLLAAAPPPLLLWGIRSHLVAFGVEHPVLERGPVIIGWRGYGQLGSVKGAFTCPTSVLGFAPGSPRNPTNCVAQSADVATLRYAGSEFEVSYRTPTRPRIIPHAAIGGNFLDTAFQTHAPVVAGMDNTRLWTRGGTLTASAGITYVVTKRTAFTVDGFYTPLWVKRDVNAPPTNDGLFNVRALLSYTFR